MNTEYEEEILTNDPEQRCFGVYVSVSSGGEIKEDLWAACPNRELANEIARVLRTQSHFEKAEVRGIKLIRPEGLNVEVMLDDE